MRFSRQGLFKQYKTKICYINTLNKIEILLYPNQH